MCGVFFFKQKTAYEMRISDWSSDVCSSDLHVDLDALRAHLDAIATICRGGPGSGPIGALPPRARFHWLTARRSSILQVSPVHTGRSDDPGSILEGLLERMVRLGAPGARSEEHTSELKSLVSISYAVFCLQKTHRT